MPILTGKLPNQIPSNQDLGQMAFQDPQSVVLKPSNSATPQSIGDVVFQRTSDTNITIKSKAADGTVKSFELKIDANGNPVIDGAKLQSGATVTGGLTVDSEVISNAAFDTRFVKLVDLPKEKEYLSQLVQTLHIGTAVKIIIDIASTHIDGGAWRKSCNDKSWYTETLGGNRWIGQQATIAAAWAAAGNSVGGVFQASATAGPITIGKYYSANSVSTVTEVFRGVTREYPSRCAWVAEGSRIIAYDLDTGAMWMVFIQVSATAPYNQLWRVGYTVSCIAALNGEIIFGSAFANTGPGGLYVVDFVADRMQRNVSVANNNAPAPGRAGLFKEAIVHRNSLLLSTPVPSPYILSETVNDVAITVLGDAPIDFATGLPVPTIYAFTSAGISRIAHDGSVSSTAGASSVGGYIENEIVYSSNTTNDLACYSVNVPLPTGGASDVGVYWGFLLASTWSSTRLPRPPFSGADLKKISYGSYAGIGGMLIYKNNISNKGNGMVAAITTSYNSGWQIGDSKLSVLASNVIENIIGNVELVTNGAFNTDVNNWSSVYGGTVSWDTGRLKIVTTVAFGGATSQLTLVVGKTYIVTGNYTHVDGSGFLMIGSNDVVTSDRQFQPVVYNVTNSWSITFVATISTAFIMVSLGSTALSGKTSFFDNISVKLAEPDRSVKNNGLIINGTIIKAPVATGSNLMGYSGFSTTNYLEQPYSNHLDFGVSEWDARVWMNAPVNIASMAATISAGGGIGTELITDTGFDNPGNWAFTQPTSGSVTVSGSALTINSADGSLCSATQTSASAVVGKTYRITFEITSTTGGGVRVDFGGVVGAAFSTTGTKEIFVTPITTASLAFVRFTGITNTVISSSSLVEVTGILPIFERTRWRNLLSWSNTFSNAAWSKAGCSITSTGIDDPFGGSTAVTITATTSFGGAFQALTSFNGVNSVWLRRRTGSGLVYIKDPGNNNAQGITLTASWQLFVSAQATGTFGGFVTIATVGDAIDICYAGATQGNLTPIRILERGGVPVTTTTATTSGPSIALGMEVSGKLVGTVSDGVTVRTVTSPNAMPLGVPVLASLRYLTTGNLELSVDDTTVATATGATLLTLNNSTAILVVGNGINNTLPFPGSLSLLRMSATVPSVDQRSQIYRDELSLFQPDAKCTIEGTNQIVTALSYDNVTDLLHVGTPTHRSSFKRLLRVESEATPAGAITNIAAKDGVVITAGTSVYLNQPAVKLRDEINRKNELIASLRQTINPLTFTATSGQTVFNVTKGYKVVSVVINGIIKTLTSDYFVTSNGYNEIVTSTAGVPVGQKVTLNLKWNKS